MTTTSTEYGTVTTAKGATVPAQRSTDGQVHYWPSTELGASSYKGRAFAANAKVAATFVPDAAPTDPDPFDVLALVVFKRDDEARQIKAGDRGVVVESFAPCLGRMVQLDDGRIVNVPTVDMREGGEASSSAERFRLTDYRGDALEMTFAHIGAALRLMDEGGFAYLTDLDGNLLGGDATFYAR